MSGVTYTDLSRAKVKMTPRSRVEETGRACTGSPQARVHIARRENATGTRRVLAIKVSSFSFIHAGKRAQAVRREKATQDSELFVEMLRIA